MSLISVKEFKGVFTNADPEDIATEFSVALQNMYPKNGRLLKTFGAGVKLDSATAQVLDQLFTYIEENLTLSGQTGEAYIGVYVAANNVVTVYTWDVTGSQWAEISTIYTNWTGTYYHKDSTNPVVMIDNIVRFLPGRLGANGVNECKGIWFGYIDDTFFDGNYNPSDGFYNYATNIDRPTISDFTITQRSYGLFYQSNEVVDTYYYKFTYIYDGNQESLFSDSKAIQLSTNDTFVEIDFDITAASHNKRITGIGVYRAVSEKELDPDTNRYELLQTINLLRASTEVKSGTDGAYPGNSYVYLSNITATFTAGYSYQIRFSDGASWIDIDSPGTGAFDVLHKTATTWTTTETNWNGYWEIQEDDGGGYAPFESNSSGAFWGVAVAIINEDVGINNYVGGVLVWDADGVDTRIIVQNNNGKAIQYLILTAYLVGSNVDWRLVRAQDGIYYVVYDGGVASYTFFDTRLTGAGTHPLLGEVSIKINADYASIINGRLWQGNLLLDPDGDYEELQPGWISYSEKFQYDVNPISNVISIPDREGGEITGLQPLFNQPVVMKKQAIFKIDTSNPEPGLWNVTESAHNIGNIPKYGSITVMDSLFVCYTDGIYLLKPNNLAETDSTPTERLKVSDPIGDVYLALSPSNLAAIRSVYDPIKNEVLFLLGTEVWAYSVVYYYWREITPVNIPELFSVDESGKPMFYDNSNKKVYSLAFDESVAFLYFSKTFIIDEFYERLIRNIIVTYKASSDLTMNLYLDIAESGYVYKGGLYNVREVPYVNGSTYTVTYDGTAYTHGQTFTANDLRVYEVSAGSGQVELMQTFTLSANTAITKRRERTQAWSKTARVEIKDSAGTTDVEIRNIEILHD